MTDSHKISRTQTGARMEKQFQKAIQLLDSFSVNPEDYRKGDYEGASLLFQVKVFQNAQEEDLDDANVYQLNKALHDDYTQELKSVLEKWQKEEACKVLMKEEAEEACKVLMKEEAFKVWISDSLLMDLNEPFHCKKPRVTQAFFLGERLPAFILTVFDKRGLPDQDYQPGQSGSQSYAQRPQNPYDEFHKLTVSAVKLLTSALLDFCHCQFAILPCTLDVETFSVESFKKELEKRIHRCLQFYDDDMYLTAATYKTLVSAAKALHGSSYLPCCLDIPKPTKWNSDPSKRSNKEWLLLLDGPWRNVLHLLIEMLTHRAECHFHVPHKQTFKVMVAVLEAVRRVGVEDEVTVSSMSEHVKHALERLLSWSKKNRQRLHIIVKKKNEDQSGGIAKKETENMEIRTDCSHLTFSFSGEEISRIQRESCGKMQIVSDSGGMLSKLCSLTGSSPSASEQKESDWTVNEGKGITPLKEGGMACSGGGGSESKHVLEMPSPGAEVGSMVSEGREGRGYLKILVPHQAEDLVIHRIDWIQRETGAMIKFPPGPHRAGFGRHEGRVCTIKGDQNKVLDAISRIYDLLSRDDCVQILVPHWSVGLVGREIECQDETGAMIQFHSDYGQSEHFVCDIKGDKKNVLEAIRRMYYLLSWTVPVQILVPPEAVALVIRERKRIKDETGAMVHFHSDYGQSGHFVCDIKGEEKNVLEAIRRMYDLLSWADSVQILVPYQAEGLVFHSSGWIQHETGAMIKFSPDFGRREGRVCTIKGDRNEVLDTINRICSPLPMPDYVQFGFNPVW